MKKKISITRYDSFADIFYVLILFYTRAKRPFKSTTVSDVQEIPELTVLIVM